MDPRTRLGPYEILEPLGAGGMGEVYRARDTILGRDVAIKSLSEAFSADAERLARLEREARLLASVNHPNVATIYGLEQDGAIRFLVMELIDGMTLAELLRGGRLPLKRALMIARQIAEGLEAAHEQGVIHRDLKPANVMVSERDQVKVLDFGIAKATAGAGAAEAPTQPFTLTDTGKLLGTAPYMSPEQVRGQPVDRRSDIWSFGCVLYELLTGQQPFARETMSDTLAAILEHEPDWEALAGAIPVRVRRLLGRCLRKEDHRRLRDIGDARLELEDLLEASGEPETDQPARNDAWQRALPWAGLGVLTLAWFVWALWPEAQPPRDPVIRAQIRIGLDRLTSSPGSALAMSPAGDYLAYGVTTAAGIDSIHVRSLDALEGSSLASGKGAERPHNPSFSPDGQWLVYVTPFELRKVPVEGGPATMICTVERSRGATWGDLDTIVLAPGRRSGLFRVKASGGSLEPLTTLDVSAGELSHRWPHFLPGERAVLFVSWTEGPRGVPTPSIEALDLATRERTLLIKGGTYPTYARSGHLLYSEGETLLAAPFDARSLALVGEAVPVVQNLDVNEAEGGAHYSLSAGGTLVYRHNDVPLPAYPTVLVDREGVASRLLADQSTYGSPEFSPDGGRLAMTVYAEDNWDVWVYELDRGTATRLTFHPEDDVAPVWSPDGQTVYFASRRGRPVHNVWRRPADGSGEPELVRESPYQEVPNDISPDGRILMISQRRDRRAHSDLMMVDLEKPGGTVTFAATERSQAGGAFSPNGRWVAYWSDESLRPQVYVRPHPPGGGKWQVSETGGGYPQWAGAGRELFFRDDEGVQVVAVEIDGPVFSYDRPQRLITGSYMGGSNGLQIGFLEVRGDYAVRPGGQAFVMFPETDAVEGPSEFVILVLSWFEELDRLVPTSR